jgi:hypothetical protein
MTVDLTAARRVKALILSALATVVILTLACNSADIPNGSVSSLDAWSHIGETEMVCGVVVEGSLGALGGEFATYLAFDNANAAPPRRAFHLVILRRDQLRFQAQPESFYMNKPLCVNGLIESYERSPQIVARSLSQLEYYGPLSGTIPVNASGLTHTEQQAVKSDIGSGANRLKETTFFDE